MAKDFSQEVVSISTEKKWAAACYVPVFNIIVCPIASVRMVNSQFCRFHARQGLVFFAFWFFTIFVSLISQSLGLMLWGVVILLHAWGIVIGLSKGKSDIPFVSKLSRLIPEYFLFKTLTGHDPEKEDATVVGSDGVAVSGDDTSVNQNESLDSSGEVKTNQDSN